MFKSKKPLNTSVDTSKTPSEHCNTNLIYSNKNLKLIAIATISGILTFSAVSASYALAGNTTTNDIISVATIEKAEVQLSSGLTSEIINESFHILSADAFRDTIEENMKKEKQAAEEKAFLENIEELAKEYKTSDELKDVLKQTAAEFEISEKVLNAALEEADKLYTTPCMPPVTGHITSGFGYRTDPFSGRQAFHYGIDIQNAFDSDICATAYGTVIKAEWYSGYGNFVSIDHGNGIITNYGHLSSFKCKEGDIVSAGDAIGTMGKTGQATGTHLHYEVSVDGQRVNPIDYIPDMSELYY